MKALIQWTSPKVFYLKTIRLTPWLGFAAAFCVFIGLGLGLYFSPPDYQQGETVRIMYIHVPCAMLSMACFAGMGGCGALLLIWQIKLAGILLRALASVGSVLAALALFTGALWGKPMWGTWWVWDARLTSEFILWTLYLAILALPSTFRQQDAADQAMAIVSLIGLVDLPIIHYSVYWWQTLHQETSFPFGRAPLIDQAMLWPLVLMGVGIASFSAWATLKLACIELLKRSRRTRWVGTLI